MRAYSLDLRNRVLADVDGGMSQAATARKYRVSTRWIYNLLQQRETTGDIAPRRGGGRTPLLAAHADQLAQLVEEQPDATLAELREKLGAAVGLSTVWRALAALKITLKKSPECGGAGPSRRRREAEQLAVLTGLVRSRPVGLSR